MTHTLILKRAPILTFILVFFLALLFAATASAQTARNSLNQDSLDAALKDLSEVYGSPVTRADQAKAICNEEQYLVECAKIGQKHGLFPKERAAQVKVLLNEFKDQAVEKLKQCGTTECLVEVATSLANSLSANNPSLARAVELTPQKVDEKRAIVETAKSAGVDIEECQTMDPDSASLELLRSCAKLAKSESMQKYIPKEDRGRAEKSDGTIALKEALAKGELVCGDGTIEGCGTFCLKPAADARNGGASPIPPVCRDIAARFFGNDGVQQLEKAHKNVRETFDVANERISLPPEEQKRDETRARPIVCPVVELSPCRSGEYRQESFNEFGCRAESSCIPFNTKTQPPPEKTDQRFICPAFPTVDSCPSGEDKVASFSSPECGTYYSCRPVPKAETGAKYPYKFGSGKVALSFDEARIYCYESGTGGATIRGDKAECEQAFGISVPNIPPEKQCSQYGSGWHKMDESGNCFSPSMTEYRTPVGVLQQCGNAAVYGCSANSGDYNNTYRGAPSGQKEQVWNSAGLRSWIRTDASSARIESLKTACASVSGGGANVWLPGAGDPTSQDFGMPNADKCAKASACTSTQYFNGAECVAGSGTSGPYNTSGTYTAPAGQKEQVWNSNGLRSWIRTDASSARIESLKTACASVSGGGGNVWLPGSGDPASADFGMPDPEKCRKASACTSSQYFDGASCSGSTGGNYSSCRSGEYWNGSACVASGSGVVGTGGGPGAVSGSCSAEQIRLLGDGCHNMGNAWFNGGMTSYVLAGSTAAKNCSTDPISNCSGGGGTGSGTGSSGGGTYQGDATSCPGFAYSTWDSTGARYCKLNSTRSCQYFYPAYLTQSNYAPANCPATDTTSPPGGGGGYGNVSGTCSAELNSLLGSGCHNMGSAWFNSAMTSYVMPGGSVVKSCTAEPIFSCPGLGSGYGGSLNGGCSVGQYRDGSGACVASPPSCSYGQYWNGSSCVTSSTQGAGSSCTSGQYWNGSSCVASGSTADYSGAQSGCASAGGTWNSSSNYCQMPNSSTYSGGGNPCPSGQYWNNSACVNSQTSSGTADYSAAQSGCASAGGTWDTAANYCRMPTSSSGSSSCTSGQYWNGSACVTSSSGTTDYSSAQSGCASAGGTWDTAANYCRMPTSSAASKALALACPRGHDWNGSYCTLRDSSSNGFLANALSAFSSLFGF